MEGAASSREGTVKCELDGLVNSVITLPLTTSVNFLFVNRLEFIKSS